MAMMRAMRDALTGEMYFKYTNGAHYRRVVAALVWPYRDEYGCSTVLGERRFPQNVLGARHEVYCLAEYRSNDVKELVTHMAIMTEQWLVRMWNTPTTDNRVYLIDDFNDEQRRVRRPKLRYGDPQMWKGKGDGLIPFYHSLVQRRTKSEKSLFLGAHCSGADQIAKLQADDMPKNPVEFPAAAALFFALAEIDVNTMPEFGERRMTDAGPADMIGGY